MTRVLLLHGGIIPHYRIPVYNHLNRYLIKFGFKIVLAANGIQKDNPHSVEIPYIEMALNTLSIVKLVVRKKIDVIIEFLDLKHLYMFPTYLVCKGILGRKMIYWGQGRDLADLNASIKNLAYTAELAWCDAIILYAEHLKKYISKSSQNKIFIANNTLCIRYSGLRDKTRNQVLNEYGVTTRKNIICVGRLQKRKRLENLVAAHASLNRPDIGLILVGPDTDGILDNLKGKNIFKIGPLYGDKMFDLLTASDLYCLPGAVGLSIVDAFHCGLPFITEEGDESAEIMYLKDGVNGFIVQRGNIEELSQKLLLLIDDDNLHKRFSDAAKMEICENGSIENLCSGFLSALFFATGQKCKTGKRLSKDGRS
jgi:glycosyltransferase involved in cell wall biosynthesis